MLLRSMKNIKWDATDFITVIIGDEHSVMPISKLGALAQQAPRKFIGGIHCLDITGKVGTTRISNSSGVDQIEMVEWHQLLPDGAERDSGRWVVTR